MKARKKTNLKDNSFQAIFWEKEHLEKCTVLRTPKGKN